MSQRIKITAILSNSQLKQRDTERPIEYQWHWSRVFAALLLVVSVLFLVTLYLFPTNDQEIAVQNTLAQGELLQTQALTDVTKVSEVAVKKADSVILSQPLESVSESIIESNNDEQVLTTEDEIALLDGEEAQQQNELSEGDDSPHTEQVEISISDIELITESEQDQVLADIALGAKMDTQSVSRALLSRKVVGREPVDIIGERIARASFTKKLYFFTEINGLKGKLVRHKWYFQDQLQADVELSVYAERYRTYSSKNIAALQLGMWRVELVAEGKTLASKQFIITEQ